MPPRLAPLAVLALALGLAGCGGGDDDARDAPRPAARTSPAPTSGDAACRRVPAPDPKPDGELAAPERELSRSRRYVASVKTSCGTFEIALDARRAPVTGGSFASLARRGFFDGLTFHRIVPGFVIQGGDPTGTGTGGPGYSITETPPEGVTYPRGTVAMAKTETEAPGTSGSQFYVVTVDDAPLDPVYARLGRVTSGLDVVDAIGAVATDAQERPVDPVVIESVTVREG